MAKIVGSYADDVLKGTGESDRIWGLVGYDTIDGGAGDDFVSGDDGRDTLTSSSGYDRLDGGADDDQIILTGTGGAVTGGRGYDGLVVDFSQNADRMVFNGANGHGYVGDPSAGDRHIFFHHIEWLRLLAGSGDDRIIGTAGGDRISTGAGDDVVHAGAGQDIITNTGGHDRLDGGEGNDRFVLVGTGSTVFGGAGDDTLVSDLSATAAPVVFNLENGHGIIGYQTSEERHLFVQYHDVERIVLTTGRGSDHITGSALRDVIETAGGNDFVDAGAGDDMITDGLGANRLFGGDGRDQIISTLFSAEIDGGAGQDWLYIKETQRTSDLTVDFAAGEASTGTVFRGIEEASLALGTGNDRVIGGDLTFLVVDAAPETTISKAVPGVTGSMAKRATTTSTAAAEKIRYRRALATMWPLVATAGIRLLMTAAAICSTVAPATTGCRTPFPTAAAWALRRSCAAARATTRSTRVTSARSTAVRAGIC